MNWIEDSHTLLGIVTAKKCHFAGTLKPSLWNVVFSSFFSSEIQIYFQQTSLDATELHTKMELYYKQSDITVFSCSVLKVPYILK